MELQRPPVFRVSACVLAAVISLSYGFHTFQLAAQNQCWAMPFAEPTICGASLFGFAVALIAILAAGGTALAAMQMLSNTAATKPNRPRPKVAGRAPTATSTHRSITYTTPAPPLEESSFSMTVNGKTFNGKTMDELRRELRAESQLSDEQIERLLKMLPASDFPIK